MNPVLVFLILLGAVALWFLLSFVFFPLGRFIYKVGKDALDEMEREDKKDEKENVDEER